MLHTKFYENQPAGSGEEDFLRVFTIYGYGGHLGHVTSLITSDFFSLYLKAFIQRLVQIGKEVSEKIWFEFLYVHHLGPLGQEMTLTFNTHIPS